MRDLDDIPAWVTSKWTSRAALTTWALVCAYIAWVVWGPVFMRFMP